MNIEINYSNPFLRFNEENFPKNSIMQNIESNDVYVVVSDWEINPVHGHPRVKLLKLNTMDIQWYADRHGRPIYRKINPNQCTLQINN